MIQLLTSLFILVISILLSIIIKHGINLFFAKIPAGKSRTLKYILRGFINLMLFFIAVLTILPLWGLNITPLLTGAGIMGLAFSLGAQSLFKDIVSGFFIILEGQLNVGDQVKIGQFEGEVRKITMRTTVLIDKKENIIYIPNSQITTIIKTKS